jgi:hypothetical protein
MNTYLLKPGAAIGKKTYPPCGEGSVYERRLPSLAGRETLQAKASP